MVAFQQDQERTQVRELAVQFLYQCEAEKLFHYSESHFHAFVSHLQVLPHLVNTLRTLIKGTYERLPDIDKNIEEASANWKLERMPMVDRNALRIAVFELVATETPIPVVLNEAIEIGKKFGSAESAAFMNGILDRIVRSRRQSV